MHTGKILNTRYILISIIGSGRFSTVWLGLDYKTQTFIAIKIFYEDYYSKGESEKVILDKIIKANCEHCLTYLDYFVNQKLICIVQPLMACSLYDILKYQYLNGFSFEIIMSIMKQISIALYDIHKKLKIAHCDLKPENILLKGKTLEIEKIINSIVLQKNIKNKLNIERQAEKIKQSFHESDGLSENEEEWEDDDTSIDTDSDIMSDDPDEVSQYSLESNDSDTHGHQYKKIIDEKYILQPEVFLADFGNNVKIEELNECGDVQTRHYRPPESILRLDMTEKIDVWALGIVTLFELITGKVLFNPHKSFGISCDLQHRL